MADKTSLIYRLFGQDVSATRALRGVGDEANKAGGKIAKGIGVGTIAAGAALGNLAVTGIASVVGGFGDLVSGAREAAKISRLTEQVIKSTGGAAGITASQVDDLSTAISNKTGVDDDAVKASANLLLTFTDVRNEVGKGNDVFNQATSLVTDMSVALGQSGKAGAIQLGKALNDPIKGVSALSKVGVSFTAQQKEQIKALTESGDKLGAQKIILGELSKEFGGAAAAGADPMQKLGTVVTNLGEGLAGKLLPFLDKAAVFIMEKVIPAVELAVEWIGTNLGPVFATAGAWIMQNLVPAIGQLAGWVTGTLIPGIQNLAAAFMQNVWPAIVTVAGIIANNLQPIIGALSDFWTNTLLPAFEQAKPVLAKVATVLGGVAAVVGIVVSWVMGKLVPAFLWVVSKVAPVVIGAVGLIADAVLGIAGAAADVWNGVTEWFGKVVDFVKGIPEKMGAGLSTLADVLTAPFRFAFNGIASLWNGTVGKLSFSIPDWVPGIGGNGWDVPDIPMLANGGIVTRPTLALVGEAGPEAVIPLGRRAKGALGGQVVVNVTVQGDTDPAGAARRIGKLLEDGIGSGAWAPKRIAVKGA